MNHLKLIIYTLLISTTTGFSQAYYNIELRNKIVKKRIEVSKAYKANDFDIIPYSQTIESRYVLSKIEQELLTIIKGDFDDFLKIYPKNNSIVRIHQGYRSQLREHGHPKYLYTHSAGSEDKISWNLKNHIVENKSIIIHEVERSSLPVFKKDFIIFFIEQLTYTFKWYFDDPNNEQQLIMTEKGEKYLEKHPDSPYRKYIKNYHGTFYEPSWFAMDLNFGFGSGGISGSMGDFLSRTWGLELDLKAYLHSSFIGVKGNITFNKTTKETYLNDIFLDKNRKGLPMSFLDFYVGRRIDLFDNISVLPHIGYSMTEFGIYWGGDAYEPGNWDVFYTWAPAYGLEINLSPMVRYKKKTHFSKFNRKLTQSMFYLRLNLMVNETGLKEVNPSLDGRSIQVNLGLGIHFRANKKTKVLF